jgi:F-type H+-transporting ATPase subunit c
MSILAISIVAAGASIAIGSLLTALAQGLALAKAMEGISRQPEASDKISGSLILGLAFIESIAIYVLAISIIILFANPFTKPAMEVEKARAEVEVLKLEMEKIKLEAEVKIVKDKAAPVKKEKK